ncbi:hypothetical protein HK104_011345, partial [Borealophlyctis nickersoniae]
MGTCCSSTIISVQQNGQVRERKVHPGSAALRDGVYTEETATVASASKSQTHPPAAAAGGGGAAQQQQHPYPKTLEMTTSRPSMGTRDSQPSSTASVGTSQGDAESVRSMPVQRRGSESGSFRKVGSGLSPGAVHPGGRRKSWNDGVGMISHSASGSGSKSGSKTGLGGGGDLTLPGQILSGSRNLAGSPLAKGSNGDMRPSMGLMMMKEGGGDTRPHVGSPLAKSGSGDVRLSKNPSSGLGGGGGSESGSGSLAPPRGTRPRSRSLGATMGGRPELLQLEPFTQRLPPLNPSSGSLKHLEPIELPDHRKPSPLSQPPLDLGTLDLHNPPAIPSIPSESVATNENGNGDPSTPKANFTAKDIIDSIKSRGSEDDALSIEEFTSSAAFGVQLYVQHPMIGTGAGPGGG